MDRTFQGAMRELQAVKDFCDLQYAAGKLSLDEVGVVYHEATRTIIGEAGIFPLQPDAVSAAVTRQSVYLMRKKLLELHPEFADALREFDCGRSR